jgi:hypothetical protein
MSDVGEYRRLHETYGIGRLASSPEEWVNHIAELMNHPTRVKESLENLEKVKGLDVRVMSKNWDLLFGSLLGI